MSEETRFYTTLQSIINDEEQPVKQLEEVRELYHRGDASADLKRYYEYDKETAYRMFSIHTRKTNQRRVLRRVLYLAAAAAILLGIIIPFLGKQEISTAKLAKLAEVPALSDSLPRIKLANGDIIEIADTCNTICAKGVLATINNNTIQLSGSSEKTALQINEIIIPRGRQYRITLADGTSVWMNSESTLKFPNRFTESRDVQLKGQAYFEVVKDGRPFRVKCSEGTVTVLGTSFDVKNYEGEPTQVTLVTGKVKFTDTHEEEVTLKPGEQACRTDKGIRVSVVDSHRFTAWKEGLIYFDDRLEDVMRNIERIYDVKVVYSCDRYKQLRFVGACSRFQTIDEFMKLLCLTQEFNYEINGNIVKIE